MATFPPGYSNKLEYNICEETQTVQDNRAAFYYAVTSMTTVGYGDIRGFNLTERIVAMFLMVLGVLFFSMASGTFT